MKNPNGGSQTFQPTETNLTRCLAVLNAKRVPVFMKGNLDKKFVGICGSEWREEFPPMANVPVQIRQD